MGETDTRRGHGLHDYRRRGRIRSLERDFCILREHQRTAGLCVGDFFSPVVFGRMGVLQEDKEIEISC